VRQDDGMADDVDEAAAALYVLPPSAFTAARTERAAGLTGAAAKAVKALRKPSVAAWAVNLLLQDGRLAEAVELSRALHEAQDDLDAAELARLGRDRRALVAGLARRAAALAAEQGSTLSASAVDEVARTVNAAIVDEQVGAAVLTGRLARTLEAGADDATRADAVGGTLPGVPERPAPPRDDLAARRAQKAAEAAAREAGRAASEAERERRRTEARAAKARERADLLHERIAELQADLARMQRDAQAADAERAARETEAAEAAERARAAAAAAGRADAAAKAARP
jgi:hypothetical protein